MQMVVWDSVFATADEFENVTALTTLQFDVHSSGEEDLVLQLSVNDGEKWLQPASLNVERNKWTRTRVLLDELGVENVIKSIKFQKVDALPSTIYIANAELNNESKEESEPETSGCLSRASLITTAFCFIMLLFLFFWSY